MKSTDNIEANWCTHTFQRYHNRECEASGWLGSMTLGFRASMVALSMIVQVSENLSWTFMVCGHGFSASSISAITAPRRGTLAQASEQSTAEQYRVLCRVRNAWIGLGQGLADKGDDCHRPVLAQSQRRDLGFLRIRPVDRVAIVPQRQVRTPFGITRHFRPFRPGVAVAVQRHALKAEADTALLELGGAISGTPVCRYGSSDPALGNVARICSASLPNRICGGCRPRQRVSIRTKRF
jgi:hypothetical protein